MSHFNSSHLPLQFLHPTHCFQDKITVGKEKQEYVRVCAFPSTKVSRHLSWMNLWQFRWRNWRLDVLWAITHFGICSSLFPLCGVFGEIPASKGRSFFLNTFHLIVPSALYSLQRIIWSITQTTILDICCYGFANGSCYSLLRSSYQGERLSSSLWS